ncbi:hypothetical protein QP387_26120, partial [Klebsiella quasipneumoniae]|uniref:hypothetical protein n=1 Tax=Klebsiella quasipneumoniae TaxID=1463165 RepID=UPI00254F76CF
MLYATQLRSATLMVRLAGVLSPPQCATSSQEENRENDGRCELSTCMAQPLRRCWGGWNLD